MALMKICEVESCGNKHLAIGLCQKHYMRFRRHGNVTKTSRRANTIRCTVEGCNRPHQCQGFCATHYWRHIHGRNMLVPIRPRKHGEKYIDSNGYVCLPGKSETGSVLHEHRAVMVEKLGRDFLPGENVHHVNGNRADNRPENLELWVTAQPSGQRPQDLVEWAYEILARYGAAQPRPILRLVASN